VSAPEAETAGIDPAVLDLLQELDGAPGGLSLARLAKRLNWRQSTLRRQLGSLVETELARVELNESGGGHVTLTPAGEALCAALRAAANPG